MRTHARVELRKRRETEFWRTVNRCLVFLIGLGSLGLIALAFIPELRKIDEMRSTLAGLEKDLAGEQLLLRQQQREEKWLVEDPEYVELLARDRLGMMKEGETVFRLDTEVPAGAAEPQADAQP